MWPKTRAAQKQMNESNRLEHVHCAGLVGWLMGGGGGSIIRKLLKTMRIEWSVIAQLIQTFLPQKSARVRSLSKKRPFVFRQAKPLFSLNHTLQPSPVEFHTRVQSRVLFCPTANPCGNDPQQVEPPSATGFTKH